MEQENKHKKPESENVEDFVRANLHYLSEEKQKLFHSLEAIKNCMGLPKEQKQYYKGGGYNGKG